MSLYLIQDGKRGPDQPSFLVKPLRLSGPNGTMATQINAANDLYQENLPELVALRNKVAQIALIMAANEAKDQWPKTLAEWLAGSSLTGQRSEEA